MRKILLALLALVTFSLAGCGYNTFQTQDEQVKSSWSEVLNQYQRRADLVPNLVNTVKGYAKQERDVFLQVTEARARVGSIQATPELIEIPGGPRATDELAFSPSGRLGKLSTVEIGREFS
jgi:LemA protein